MADDEGGGLRRGGIAARRRQRSRRPGGPRMWGPLLLGVVVAAPTVVLGVAWVGKRGGRARVPSLSDYAPRVDYGRQADARPRDAAYLVTMADVGLLGFEPNILAETRLRTVYADGMVVTWYEYSDDQRPGGPYLLSLVGRAPTEESARSLLSWYVRHHLHSLERTGAPVERRDDLLEHGDDSQLAFVTSPEGDPWGAYFHTRKGTRILVFICYGVALEGPELVGLLAPFLERFETWEP